MKKYTYYRVIQANHGYGWDDEDFHESDSSGHPLDYAAYRTNVMAYIENCKAPIRTVIRRELNENH